MPIEYNFDHDLNMLHVHPFGSISSKDIIAYFESIADDDRILNDFFEVVHFGEVENFTFSSDQVSDIAMAFNEVREKKGVGSTVFIGTSDMHYGIGRMFQAFINFYCPGHVVYVVRNEEEARKAITGKDD